MQDRAASVTVESRFIAAPDGLSLHVRCYEPAADSPLWPVLCLPGLTRNEADFTPLAMYLAADRTCPRRVFALDSRGRGRSAYDPDWRNYNPAVELADVIAAMSALGLPCAAFVGTSRGGILTMLLAAVQPGLIAGAVLNDIGPVIEPEGLARIKRYAGKIPQPRDFVEGAGVLRELFGAQFPSLDEAGWLAWAHRSWRRDKAELVGRYDQALANTLDSVTPDQPMPDLWAQFDALPSVPLMVVRGMLSDILSAETVVAMRARRPDIEVLEVPDQGHAPLLAEPEIMSRVSAFLARCDRPASR
jgi:pimeloyl-ACP methyl ester carboxylesterase